MDKKDIIEYLKKQDEDDKKLYNLAITNTILNILVIKKLISQEDLIESVEQSYEIILEKVYEKLAPKQIEYIEEQIKKENKNE